MVANQHRRCRLTTRACSCRQRTRAILRRSLQSAELRAPKKRRLIRLLLYEHDYHGVTTSYRGLAMLQLLLGQVAHSQSAEALCETCLPAIDHARPSRSARHEGSGERRVWSEREPA